MNDSRGGSLSTTVAIRRALSTLQTCKLSRASTRNLPFRSFRLWRRGLGISWSHRDGRFLTCAGDGVDAGSPTVYPGAMRVAGIDHFGLEIGDLDRSLAFYRDVLGFVPLPRPDLGYPGAWLRVGERHELHLLQRGDVDAARPRAQHVALEVDDVQAWATHLQGHGVPLRGPRPRPDGALQAFVTDPDGHVLELLERRRVARPLAGTNPISG